MRIRVVAVTVVTAASVAFSAAVLGGVTNPADSPNDGAPRGASLAAAMRACVPVPAGSGNAVAVAGCVEEVLVEAGRRSADLHDVITRATAVDPWFADACHLGAHRAGKELASDIGAVDALATVTNLCSSGMIHGIFDAVGVSRPSKGTWQQLAATCLALRMKSPAACPDGMGHAAWDATGEVVAAEAVCMAFDDPAARSECAEGVVMQRFAPATERANRPRDARPVDPMLYCRMGGDAAIYEGCLHGVGWLLANDLAGRADALGALRGEVPSDAVDPLRDEFTAAASVCAELGAGEGACTHRLLTAVPLALYRDATTREALCTAVPAVRERCSVIAATYAGVAGR